jgi:serine/threonine protein phosphatase PrpC
MHNRKLKFQSVGRTHAGCVRTLNEDAMLERPDIGLWAISDGMGGHTAGDVASSTIVESLKQVVRKPGAAFADTVRAALADANSELHRRSAALGPGSTMGATVAILGADEGEFFCLWAGDSRLYRYDGRQLSQVTRDHRYIQNLLDTGALQPDEAERHPLRNVITRAVGINPQVELDHAAGPIAPGDMFLLVTDGVTTVCKDEELAGFLAAPNMDLAANSIVARCIERGAPDNLSLVIVQALAA